jgi:hypothetical protein
MPRWSELRASSTLAAGVSGDRRGCTMSDHAAPLPRMPRSRVPAMPPLGIHLLMGGNALLKTRNSARNIEEGRTHPVQVICRKPR